MTDIPELFYKVISTGSKGNAVIVDRMLFDCGVSFKALKEYLYDIDYLFVTHRHSDHLKPQTLLQIRKVFPHIRVIGNYDVAYTVPVDVITNNTVEYTLKKYQVLPFKNYHDVPCQGYSVSFKGINIIYTTDTASLQDAPIMKYDYLFLESNHDENKLKGLSANKYGYNVIEGAMRHLSTQKCKAFYYINRRSKESKLIELHQSERFY